MSKVVEERFTRIASAAKTSDQREDLFRALDLGPACIELETLAEALRDNEGDGHAA